MSFNNNIIIT